MKTQFFICLVFSLAFNHHASLQSISDNNNYRAAKYSFMVDFSKYKQAMPEMYMLPESSFSFAYYVQYGKDTLIELLQPGSEIKYFSGWINTLDYNKRVSTFVSYTDQTRSYVMLKDSLPYNIDESRGTTTSLCHDVELNSRCDSLTFLLHSTNVEYKMFFNDTIANLRSKNLFYPDIKYLPSKIIRMSRSPVTFNLEDILYGKPAVDSLLYLFSYTGYEKFNVDDVDPADLKMITEFVESLECIEDK